MEFRMAVSREKIKALREARAWSQAHLAEAASLSLRTVQRVEAEGTASAETRLAIAAALSVSVDELNAPAPVVEPEPSAERIDPGPVNTLLMFAVFGVALLFMLWLGSRLPEQVASHFGVAGDANARMSRDSFVAASILTMLGVPLLIWVGLVWGLRHQTLKIPNARYWLAQPRRQDTERFLLAHFTWLSVIVTVFMGYTFWLVASANTASPAHPALDIKATYIGLGAFLAIVAAWVTRLSLRFRRAGS